MNFPNWATWVILVGCLCILFAYSDEKWYTVGNDATVAFWVGITLILIGGIFG